MASLRDHSPGTWPLKRSRLPALLAGALSVEHGIFDALILNAVAGTALGAAALHLWGSALAGRVGGAVAVLLSLAMSPLVLQARMLSYYPMLNAGLALCAAGVAVAARTRSPLGLLLAGVGVGAALLSDVRGLVWALPCLGVALTIAVFAAGKPWLRVARVAALALPVALSYPLGAEVFSGATYSLEKQIDVRPLYHLHGSRAEGFRPPFSYESNYIWGHSDPLELPETLRFMVDNATVPQPDDLQMHTPQGLLASQVTPWSRAALVLVPLSFAALIRRPWALWASFGAALPYLVALRSMNGMVEMYPRFLTQALPAVAIAGGVVVAAVWRLVPWERLGRAGPLLGWASATGLFAALVFGGIPSPLSPVAGWRMGWAPVLTEVYWVGQDVRSPTGPNRGSPQEYCVRGILEDQEHLGAEWSRLVSFSDRQQTDYRQQLSTVPPSHPGGRPGAGGPPR